MTLPVRYVHRDLDSASMGVLQLSHTTKKSLAASVG
jgi:hypothetical protein